MKGLVSAKWLKANLNNENLVILDATQLSSVNALDNSLEGLYIPGAIHFDLKEFSDQESDLPNTLPDPKYFQEQSQKLGIKKGDEVVIYDTQGVYFSPRVWWMFLVMGHERVMVLNGGLPAWIDQGGAVSRTPGSREKEGNFEVSFNSEMVKTREEVLQNIDQDLFHVVDARSQGRFDGSAPEPREGLKSGHIPNSSNLPYPEVLDGYFLKSAIELSEVFETSAQDKPLVFSCGSGLTACILALANYIRTEQVSPVYDGSWTEWAQDSSSPIHTSSQ